MKAGRSLVAVVLAAAALPAVAQTQQADSVERIMADYVKPDAPGCSVATSKDGRTLLSRGFGLANLEHRVPITPATRFDIASASKQFTAAAILLLVQDGKISLDDDIRKYVPELPEYGSKITIDQLLTHTAGLRDYPFLTELQGWWPEPRRQFSQEELVSLIVRQRHLNFVPGERWSYSNSGYILAADIVRRVSGQSLREFMQKRIFEPLGMRATVLRDDYSAFFAGQADNYFGPPSDLKKATPAARHGDSNLVSTVDDLLIWNRALDSGVLGPLVTSELQREARSSTGHSLRYARGLFIGDHRGVREVGHSGGSLGSSAYTVRYPDQRLSVAIACNSGQPVEQIARKIAELYLTGMTSGAGPARPARPATAVAIEPQRLVRLAGLFFDEARGTHVRASIKDGKLHWGREVAEPLSGTRFTLASSAEFEFTTPDVVTTFGVTGTRRTFRRVEDRLPTINEVQALAGDYRSEELGTVYRVAAKEREIVLSIVDGPPLEWPIPAASRDIFDAGRDTIRFLRNSAGRGEAFLISNARNTNIRFDRVSNR
jgi:CubicO group peptidase (beta-lactamase class C family)